MPKTLKKNASQRKKSSKNTSSVRPDATIENVTINNMKHVDLWMGWAEANGFLVIVISQKKPGSK